MLKEIQFATRLGLMHVYFGFGGEMDFGGLLEPQKSQLQAFWSSPQYFQTQGAEIGAGRGIWADALNLEGLGNKPLMVISRGVNLDDEWSKYQDELASLSTNSRHITVEGANHTALVFEEKYAHIVSNAILQVLDAVRTGKRFGDQT
jgi:hypothetical protein